MNECLMDEKDVVIPPEWQGYSIFSPVSALPDAHHASRDTAYILPDNTVWVLNYSGSALIPLGSGGGTGREVELRNNGTAIQWRYVGDTSWIDLVQLADLMPVLDDTSLAPWVTILDPITKTKIYEMGEE